jgi:ABC-type molybdenum transport system ATPase subunit/photorepair protein PhrA
MWTSGQPQRTPDGREVHVDVKGGGARMDVVSMRAGGHGLLSDMTLRIQPGEHVAIIGLLEAGKSNLEELIEAAQERPNGRAR